MLAKIRELYQKLYNENYQLLEGKKKDVKEEGGRNNASVAKSIASRACLKKQGPHS